MSALRLRDESRCIPIVLFFNRLYRDLLLGEAVKLVNDLADLPAGEGQSAGELAVLGAARPVDLNPSAGVGPARTGGGGGPRREAARVVADESSACHSPDTSISTGAGETISFFPVCPVRPHWMRVILVDKFQVSSMQATQEAADVITGSPQVMYKEPS